MQNGTYYPVSGLMVVLPKAADQLHIRNAGGIFESMISKCCFGLAYFIRALPFLMHCAITVLLTFVSKTYKTNLKKK